MPAYDYRCRTCDTSFEVRRALSDPATGAACPSGHTDTTRLFSAVAVGVSSPADRSAAGGCCGGGCCG